MKKTQKKLHYQPLDSKETPKFCGIRTFMRLPHVQTVQDIDFAVIGVPFDGGTTLKTGARFGPSAIRENSINLKPFNPAQQIAIFDHCSGVDYGDLAVIPGYIEDSLARIKQGLLPLVENGVVPIILGGDHSISLAGLRACAEVHGPVSLVHFDAHPDTGKEYFGKLYTHGTPFRRAVEEGLLLALNSLQLGLRGQLYDKDGYRDSRELGFTVVTALELEEMGIAKTLSLIHEKCCDKPVYISFDIDFLDPAYAPGTGTPEIGGFTSREALRLIRSLDGLNIIGCDVVEVLPAHDPANITALLAAGIGYELISLVALQKRQEKPSNEAGAEKAVRSRDGHC